MTPGAAGQALTVVHDATCLACGCLCDDIIAHVDQNQDRIVASENTCERGASWFAVRPRGRGNPLAAIQGRDASSAAAVARAATILERARCPIVLGLEDLTLEGQAAAVALADRVGASIDAEGAAAIHALQRVGHIGATWGEVRHRADAVLYWFANPVETHPRHWDRFIAPPGRFLPEGRAGRRILVADSAATATSRRADAFLQIHPDRAVAALWCLRALSLGIELDAARVLETTGVQFDLLRDWSAPLRTARHVAVISGASSAEVEEALARFVLDGSKSRRFVACGLGNPGNPSGAMAVLAWQTGFPNAVDFARGYPRFLPDEAAGANRLERGEADAAVVLGACHGRLSERAFATLERTPRIVITPDATAPGRVADVALSAADIGIETLGTVVRSDGVPLPLRVLIEARRPTHAEWINVICDMLT